MTVKRYSGHNFLLMLMRLKRNNACTSISVSEIVHQYVGTELLTIKTSLELSEVAFIVCAC